MTDGLIDCRSDRSRITRRSFLLFEKEILTRISQKITKTHAITAEIGRVLRTNMMAEGDGVVEKTQKDGFRYTNGGFEIGSSLNF